MKHTIIIVFLIFSGTQYFRVSLVLRFRKKVWYYDFKNDLKKNCKIFLTKISK
jgi:hypothetical protein